MFSFGFSVGASWVGWAVVQGKEEILEAGVNLFSPFDGERSRRRNSFRQAKRLNRRRQARVRDFEKLWLSQGFSLPEASDSKVLQLRNQGLEERLAPMQLYVVLKNYLLHRGVFYQLPENPEGVTDKALLNNIEELKEKGYPCKLQLERLQQYGSYRGTIEGEKVSNTFPAEAYRAEARALIEKQEEYYPCIDKEFTEKYFSILERKRKFYGEEGFSWNGREGHTYQERLEGKHALKMVIRILKALIKEYGIPEEIVFGHSLPSEGEVRAGREERDKDSNTGENGKREEAEGFLKVICQGLNQWAKEAGISAGILRMEEDFSVSGRRKELKLREEQGIACYSDYALEAMLLCFSDGMGREPLRKKLLEAERQVKYWHQVDRKANRTLCNQTIRGTRSLEGKVMKVNKLSLYTQEGYKTFVKLLSAGKQELFLMYRHDRKSWDNLMEIYQGYKGNKNAFTAYRKDTGDTVRKYARNGQGAPVKQLKYLDGELGSCVDISHKYGHKRGERRVILENLRPYRTDVYFNRGTGRYHLVGVKYSDLKYTKDGYMIDGEAYHQALIHERVLEGSSQMVLMGMETEYLFSLYKNDLIEYEKDGKRYVERFLSRTQPGKMNYIETKPVERDRFENKRHQVGLAKASSIRKIRTDILGNRYYCGFGMNNATDYSGIAGCGWEKFTRRVDLY